jgi:hypothetical protein
VRCIYFDGEKCNAHPPIDRLAYKPDEKEKKDYCENPEFTICPRLKAFVNYLEAMAKPSR